MTYKEAKVPLTINNSEVDKLIEQVVSLTGETKTRAVAESLHQRLGQLNRRQSRAVVDELNLIAERCAALPDQDSRSPDEILGYNSIGIPE